MAIVSGLDSNSVVQPLAVDHHGRLVSGRPTTLEELLKGLLLELRAARIGLEMLNDLEPGDLLEVAQAKDQQET